jgi:thiol:disulfide interchange protein DsbG
VKQLNATHPLKEGADTAPRKVFVFADPFCPYCKTFWSEAQPWVKAGKVQLNTLLVAFLNPNSGRNATAILNAKDPVSAWREYELSGGKHCLRVRQTPPGRPLHFCSSTRS